MKLVDWAGLYAIVGVAIAIAIARRGRRRATSDLVLAAVLWPIYVPLLVSASPLAPSSSEHLRLAEAIAAIQDRSIARLLPTPAQLDALGARLAQLDARVRALDAAVANERPPPDDDVSPHADGARAAVRRLAELRGRAHDERDELAGLVRTLRVQITVIGFSGASPADALDVAAEIAARVEGVGAALADPEVELTARR